MSSRTEPGAATAGRARATALVAALLLGGAGLIALAAWWQPPVVDLQVYRDAAARILDGTPLYPPGSRYAADQPLPFTYPPFAAMVLLPLALVPLPTATGLWWLVTAAALCWLLARSFAPVTRRLSPVARVGVLALLAVPLVVAFAPVTRVVAFGQVGLVLAALCLLDLDLAVRRPSRSGVLVGLATAVKLTPAAFALTFVAAGRRRAAVVAAATCAILWLAAAVVLPDDTRTWLGLVRDTERIGPVDGAMNVSWHGLWLRLLGDSTLTTVLWLAFAAATLGVGAVRSGRLLRAGHSLSAATVMGLAAVLASPVSWLHHAVWVVPLLGVVLDDGRSWRRWVVALAVFAVFSEAGTAWQDLDPGTAQLAGVLDWFWVNTCVLVMAAAVVLLSPGPGTRPLTAPSTAAETPRRADEPSAA